jgi:uncharacterized lipoprotein YmbA
MKTPLLLTTCALLLSGCIIFDKKSEAVTFHQLAAPAASAPSTTSAGQQVFIPRAIVPAALRRPNVVLLDDTGWVRVEDNHRWIAPLDRAIPEAVGRHLGARTGVTTAMQTPAADHLVLLLTIDKMEVFAPAAPGRSLFSLPGTSETADSAILQATCRLEKSDGTLVTTGTFTYSQPLKTRGSEAFVQAQSANLAALSAELAKWLLPSALPSSK